MRAVKPFRFCPYCATPLEERPVDHRVRRACPRCSFVHYANPVPAAGVALVEKGELLLVRRKFEPRSGYWSLPAGFVEGDEDVRRCAVRETFEETHLEVELLDLLGVYSAFDDPRTSAVLVLYWARRVGGELRCGDDASDARFVPLDEIRAEQLAFEAHRQAVEDIRRKL
jgi:ADP-ribose pyrophosphatase YjhB (NUDIX family)